MIFVDLGFRVLEIPKAEIARRETRATSRPKDEVATADPGSPEGDYVVGDGTGRTRSVEELSKALGSTVVLVSSPSKSGSGFFVNDRGWIVTNFHVIEGDRKIAVTVFESRGNGYEKKKIEDVEIVALAPYYDLAVLKLPEKKLGEVKFKPAAIGAATRLEVGEDVFAIGNPLGLERTVTQGIVSIKAREHEGLLYVQTTTQINPGNSGGPLFNMKGEVVGVTNMGYSYFEGLGFAIPTRRVQGAHRQHRGLRVRRGSPQHRIQLSAAALSGPRQGMRKPT